MNVIVDTSVWSLALRRQNSELNRPIVSELEALISNLRVVMIGPVRQELLSGIRHKEQFVSVRSRLRAFPDFSLSTKDYEQAAEFFNICRGHGVQGSNTDFLICAVAVNNKFSIFTTDNDFMLFADYLPIERHVDIKS